MPILAANWKMYKTVAEAEVWLGAVAGRPELELAEVVVFPPLTALHVLRGSGLGLGAQDVGWATEGAFTGMVSAPQLRDAGCAYALVAHSERRRYAGEDDRMAARKIAALWQAGLTPVYCVGEDAAERAAGQGEARLRLQVDTVLDSLGDELGGRLVIAYEPVWAIGSGTPATAEQAGEALALIRERVVGRCGGAAAARLSLLYGGSTSPASAGGFMEQPIIDGLLVGSASLDANSFLAMLEVMVHA
jgi:triosephosphate isomerase